MGFIGILSLHGATGGSTFQLRWFERNMENDSLHKVESSLHPLLFYDPSRHSNFLETGWTIPLAKTRVSIEGEHWPSDLRTFLPVAHEAVYCSDEIGCV